MQLFDAHAQELADVTWSTDANDDFVATFSDGCFLKFPAGSTWQDIEARSALIAEHSAGQEVITEAMLTKMAEVKAANEALLAQLNGSAPEVAETPVEAPVEPSEA